MPICQYAHIGISAYLRNKYLDLKSESIPEISGILENFRAIKKSPSQQKKKTKNGSVVLKVPKVICQWNEFCLPKMTQLFGQSVSNIPLVLGLGGPEAQFPLWSCITLGYPLLLALKSHVVDSINGSHGPSWMCYRGVYRCPGLQGRVQPHHVTLY